MEALNLKVKSKVEDSNRVYLLLLNNANELLPKDSIANIIATDKEGYILWVIEPPTTKYDVYARLYFDDNKLFAASSGGQLHEIDNTTGKIIKSEMIK